MSGGLDGLPERDQPVGVVRPDAVAGVEEQARRIRAGVPQTVAEVLDGANHRRAVRVEQVADLEVDRFQRTSHQFGVVGRVGQWRHMRVGAVADHQRDALLGGGGPGRCGEAQRQGGNRPADCLGDVQRPSFPIPQASSP